MAKITVLVGLYKASQFLEAKLRNLSAQTIFDDCQIVLLNCQDLENESGIYSDFLASNENVVEIKYSEHVGLYRTWNDGIQRYPNEYVVNANVDDMWADNYLEQCVKVLGDQKECSVVYSYVSTTATPNQFDSRKWKVNGGLSRHSFPGGTMGPCPMWRNSLHEKYGYFEDYQIISDGLMWHKWRRGGEIFYQIRDSLVLYYHNPKSLERRYCHNSKLPLIEVELRKIGVHGAKN